MSAGSGSPLVSKKGSAYFRKSPVDRGFFLFRSISNNSSASGFVIDAVIDAVPVAESKKTAWNEVNELEKARNPAFGSWPVSTLLLVLVDRDALAL